jgi:hypothetical protein
MKNAIVQGFVRWMSTFRYSHIVVGLSVTLAFLFILDFLTGFTPGVVRYGGPFGISAVLAFLEWSEPNGFMRRFPPAS